MKLNLNERPEKVKASSGDKKSFISKMKWITPFLLPVLMIVAWIFASKAIGNQSVLPSPGKIVYNFTHSMDNFIGLGSLPRKIGYILVRDILCYGLGVLVAVPLGL